jgi:hypothetical protein
MSPEERLWMLTAACAEVLSDENSDALLVVEAQDHEADEIHQEHQYALVWRPEGRRVVEVSCREWDCPWCDNRPLPPSAVSALRDLGFSDGGHRMSPYRDAPEHASALAVLVERALTAAYDLPADFEVVLYPGDHQAYEGLVRRLSGPSPI